MMCNASWKRRITLLVVLTVAFIWGNSLMPGTVSGAISDWAGAVLSRIFGGEVDTVHGHGVLRISDPWRGALFAAAAGKAMEHAGPVRGTDGAFG